MSVLISQAKIWDPNSKHHLKNRNVFLKNGYIKYIGSDEPTAKQKVAAKGSWLTPGLCDLQAAYQDPGNEHKEDLATGMLVAEAGGFTDVAVLPNTTPPIQKKNDIKYITKQNHISLVQLHPIGAVSIDLKGEALTDMLDMAEMGAVAFSDGLQPMHNTDLLMKSLQYITKINGLIIDRPQEYWLALFGQMHEGKHSALLGMKGIPSIAEELAVARNLQILAYTGGRLHMSNISTKGAVNQIKNAKKVGLKVTCDVAAHQLVYTDAEVLSFDSNYKVMPPLRSTSDIHALLKGLKEGTIDAIVSSHQPHDPESKQLEFDLAEPGIISQQTVLSMLAPVAEQLGWALIFEKLTHAPRAILNLAMPSIAEGEKANIQLYNPKKVWTLNQENNRSKSQNSPLWNQELTGKVEAVFNNGYYKIFS